MAYLSQLTDGDEEAKQTLESDLQCFLLDGIRYWRTVMTVDTHRVVDELFKCIHEIETDKQEETKEEEQPQQIEEEAGDEYNPSMAHSESNPVDSSVSLVIVFDVDTGIYLCPKKNASQEE